MQKKLKIYFTYNLCCHRRRKLCLLQAGLHNIFIQKIVQLFMRIINLILYQTNIRDYRDFNQEIRKKVFK